MGVIQMSRWFHLVAALLGCLAWGAVAATSGVAAEAPLYDSSFGPDGSEGSGFGKAGPVAVDHGDELVYVLDRENQSLLKFDLSGNPVSFGGSAPYISGNELTGLSLAGGIAETQVAVDSISHEIYVTSGNSITAFQADGEPSKFTTGPGAGTNAIGGFSELLGIAVDVNGAIYASDYAGTVEIYSQAGELITEFSATEPANLAVDTNGNVYVNRWQLTVSKFSPSVFPVTASTAYTASPPLDPVNGSFTVAVDQATNDVYVTPGQSNPGVSRYNEAGDLLATFGGEGEEGELSFSEGVAAIGGESGKVFVSDVPSEGLSQVKIFQYEVYLGPPKVETVYVSKVTPDSAALHAEINPGGFETTYWFEYGLADCSGSTCTSIPLGGESIGDGSKPVSVSQVISGLQPGTTYHFRVRAENAEGAEVGPGSGDHVFTTQADAAGFRLSDSRAWEMVSPVNKHSGVLTNNDSGLIQASEDGNALAYLSKGPVAEEPEGNRTPERSTTLAWRSASGWGSEDIMPPNEKVVPILLGMNGEYKLFSPHLERGLLEPLSDTPLSSEASERTPYLRENTAPPVFRPLVTGKEGFANVPSGTEFGGKTQEPAVRIEASSSSLGHVGLRSSVPLLGSGDPVRSLYEWAGGQLHRVNVLPDTEGGTMVVPSVFGSDVGSMRHAISDDGSRVFWSAGQYSGVSNNLTALYMRDTAAEETVRLDVPKGGSGTGTAHPVFQGANPEGTVVFFTDSRQLTADASPEGVDLYRCEIPAGSPASGCSTLTNITGVTEEPTESAEIQGIISGLSEDGGKAYFVAKGVLDGTPSQEGDTAVSGEPNLYAWEESGGVRFIAVLAPEDAHSWGVRGEALGVAETLSAGSSPSGRYLAFMSERSLTGYDNREATSGEPVQEVFRYDAVTERLDCVSCNPSGAIPAGFIDEDVIEPTLIDPRNKWAGRWLAAILPAPSTIGLGRPSLYQPRFMLDNGRVLFNAFDGLVAADLNEEWDTYQYEPSGVGSCSDSSGDSATARSAGGCVSLMSSGTATEEAVLLDVSASGDDVFFLSGARLAVTDEDEELDVYDARVGGVAPVRPPVIDCSGEACRPQAPPPPPVSPRGSAAFSGPENVKERRRCPKGKRKVRRGGKVKCVPRKQQKHKKKQQKAGSNKVRGR
jgi:hypothetical protein